MKKQQKLAVVLGACLLTLFMGFSCENGRNVFTDEAYIVGLDPCTIEYPTGAPNKGYVLELVNNSELVLSYNLSKEKAEKVEESNMIYPLQEGYLFPLENRKIFKIKISYRYANADERVNPICKANIDLSGISKVKNQIMIQSID